MAGATNSQPSRVRPRCDGRSRAAHWSASRAACRLPCTEDEDRLRVAVLQPLELGVEVGDHVGRALLRGRVLRVVGAGDERREVRAVRGVLLRGGLDRRHHAEGLGEGQLLVGLVSDSTSEIASSLLPLSSAMPQQFVNASVPLPGGPRGQLGDRVVDVREVVGHRAGDPVALDGHRGLLLAERLATPAGAEVGRVRRHAVLHQSSARRSAPRRSPGCRRWPRCRPRWSSRRPACGKNAPTRWYSGPKPSPTTSALGQLARRPCRAGPTWSGRRRR